MLSPGAVAGAHPLGNFTVNTYSGIRVEPSRLFVNFVVDMAEIPALQTKQTIPGNATPDSVAGRAYRGRECDQLAAGADVRLDGHPLPLTVASTTLAFPPGQAGLTTLRLTCDLVAAGEVLHGEHDLAYRSDNFTDRVGWREITAVGDHMTLSASDVPTRSPSAQLTRYPTDLLRSPLDQRRAHLRIQPGGPGALTSANRVTLSPLPRGVDRATQAFTSFVGRHHLSIGFAALAVLLSVLLGAVHALAPGHGKTMMAAYLVGQRGSLRQAVEIGLTVTATHTVGVLALGLAISASAVVTPERLYPWLGLASGLLLAAIGGGLLMRLHRLRKGIHEEPHHGHAPDAVSAHHHGHDHGFPSHRHGVPDPGQAVRRRDLLAMGFVGGLLPSPSAVVVLLGAITLGRIWFGVVLVMAYGLGMAATLTGAGTLLLRARGVLDHRFERFGRSRWTAVSRLAPVATAALIIVVGSALALRAATQIPR